MNPIPQIAKPILDVYANKDSFHRETDRIDGHGAPEAGLPVHAEHEHGSKSGEHRGQCRDR
jgi:hypothetical protein